MAASGAIIHGNQVPVLHANQRLIGTKSLGVANGAGKSQSLLTLASLSWALCLLQGGVATLLGAIVDAGPFLQLQLPGTTMPPVTYTHWQDILEKHVPEWFPFDMTVHLHHHEHCSQHDAYLQPCCVYNLTYLLLLMK